MSLTRTSAEDVCQSDWSLEEWQELLGEVTAEKPRFHAPDEEPMEDMQENLSQLPPDATENLTKEPVVEVCTRATTSSNIPFKKNPVENAGQESMTRSLPEATENGANDELANEPTTVKSCSIVTASRELLIK